MADRKPFTPILCLDFDGVLHSYASGWKGAGTIPDLPVPGAITFLVNATLSFEVAIFSSRSKSLAGRWAMKRWVRKHGAEWLRAKPATHVVHFPWYSPGMDPPEHEEAEFGRCLVKQIKWPWFKPSAFIGLDDRVLTFDGTWPNCADLHAFKPWNKR